MFRRRSPRGPAHEQGFTKCVFLARAPHGGRTDGPAARAVTADSSSPRRGRAEQQGAAAPCTPAVGDSSRPTRGPPTGGSPPGVGQFSIAGWVSFRLPLAGHGEGDEEQHRNVPGRHLARPQVRGLEQAQPKDRRNDSENAVLAVRQARCVLDLGFPPQDSLRQGNLLRELPCLVSARLRFLLCLALFSHVTSNGEPTESDMPRDTERPGSVAAPADGQPRTGTQRRLGGGTWRPDSDPGSPGSCPAGALDSNGLNTFTDTAQEHGQLHRG
jgi:hypothetical protein